MPAGKVRSLLSLVAVFAAFGACQTMEPEAFESETYLDLPPVPYSYEIGGPAMGTLGRVLFYDKSLSLNNTIACASCHQQSASFSDSRKFSMGFEGRFTSRNSMPIQNLTSFSVLADPSFKPITASSSFAFGQHLFWDGRETNLQQLILQPVGNHIEMGITDVNALAEKLSQMPHYKTLFTAAFQSAEITPQKISTAVATFLSNINTGNTRFDQYKRSFFVNIDGMPIEPVNNPGVKPSAPRPASDFMSPLEIEGMMLFESKYDCNSCHQVSSPNGYIFAGTFANIGLDQIYKDAGLQETTGNPADAGKFKIPSLRNVEFTAPYMHDGRFTSLDDVVDHYSSGIEDHPNLDQRLASGAGQAKAMNISEHEKQAIVAFLRTLSDRSVMTDPRFSNPFKTR